MQSTTESFPKDLQSAQALIVALQSEFDKREKALCEQINEDQRKIESLQQQLHWLRNRVFGRRSEQGTGADQLLLPLGTSNGEIEAGASDEDGAAESEVRSHRRKSRGRKALPAKLPRETIELEPSAEEKYCACCSSEKSRIGEDRSEELDYVPASFLIREYVRPKYACRQCGNGVVQAPLPARPIEKGRPGAGLLAHVVTSKYSDGMPLYRLERIFPRHGIDISRSTLSAWCGAVSDLLEPVASEIASEVLKSAWIQSDDTRVDVRKGGDGKTYRQGHIWVYRGATGDAFYDFTWKRNSEGPLRLLEQYEGYLQADAAPAYDEVYRQLAIQEVGCWAHARRRFKEAVRTAPQEASQVVVWIGELYGLERSAKRKQLSTEARHALRQERARPILERIGEYLKKLQLTTLPKSPLADAIGYALRQWEALNRYTDDGRLEIDNNGAENALRPLCLGRKNWLFIGSEAAAHRTMVLLTLVQSCRAHGVDPFAYLRDIIDRVSTHPMSRINELIPQRWKELRTNPATPAG